MNNHGEETSYLGWLFVALFFLGMLFLGGTYACILFQKPTLRPQITDQTAINQKQLHKLSTDLQKIAPKKVQDDFTQVDTEIKNL